LWHCSRSCESRRVPYRSCCHVQNHGQFVLEKTTLAKTLASMQPLRRSPHTCITVMMSRSSQNILSVEHHSGQLLISSLEVVQDSSSQIPQQVPADLITSTYLLLLWRTATIPSQTVLSLTTFRAAMQNMLLSPTLGCLPLIT